MTTRASTARHRPRRNSGCIALERMTDAGLGPLGWLAPAFRDCVGDSGTDFAEFVAHRIGADHRPQHRLLRCRTADEMRAVQSTFLAEAADEYNARTGSRVRISAEVSG